MELTENDLAVRLAAVAWGIDRATVLKGWLPEEYGDEDSLEAFQIVAAEAERYAEERVAADRAAGGDPAPDEEVAEGYRRVIMPVYVGADGSMQCDFIVDYEGKFRDRILRADWGARVRVTADIPLPKPLTVRGEVTP